MLAPVVFHHRAIEAVLVRNRMRPQPPTIPADAGSEGASIAHAVHVAPRTMDRIQARRTLIESGLRLGHPLGTLPRAITIPSASNPWTANEGSFHASSAVLGAAMPIWPLPQRRQGEERRLKPFGVQGKRSMCASLLRTWQPRLLHSLT